MLIFPNNLLPSSVASEMYRRAFHGLYTGTETRENQRLINHCTATWTDGHIGVILIFTRDDELHTGGMLRNPDFERCYHLSLSFRDPISGEHVPFDKAEAKIFVEAFFSPENIGKLWIESPKTPQGKKADVWHYRLMCDANWRGITPRGEVYSSEFTELGWKSFSEIHDTLPPIMPGWGSADK
jgi:hypothetical protein